MPARQSVRSAVHRRRDGEGRIEWQGLIAPWLEPNGCYPPFGAGVGGNHSFDRRVVDLGQVVHVVGRAVGSGALVGPRVVVPERDRDQSRRRPPQLGRFLLTLAQCVDESRLPDDRRVVGDHQCAIGRDRLGHAGDRPPGKREIEPDHAEVECQVQLVPKLDVDEHIAQGSVDGTVIEHQLALSQRGRQDDQGHGIRVKHAANSGNARRVLPRPEHRARETGA